MRRIFILLSLLLPLSVLAQDDDWRGGYSELEDEEQTVENFFNSKDNNNYKVVSVGYSSTFDGDTDGMAAYFGVGRNIACQRLPLYLEFGVKYMYGEDWPGHSIYTLGVPITLTYKLKYKDFQLMPIMGPTFNAVDFTDERNDDKAGFGISWDLGFRIGYKKCNLEYRHAYDLKDFGGEANLVGISILW